MSVDIASLSIQVDSTSARTAKTDLDKLSDSGCNLTGIIEKIVAAWSSWKIVQYAKDAALLSARYETLGVVMGVIGNNAGYTKAQMDLFDQGLQRTGISMVESRNNLTRMAAAQLDLTKASQLGRVAQDAAVIAGINSSEAFENLVQGIVSGQPRILHTMGIFADFGREEKAWAEAHGRTKESLSQVELVQIRLNGTLEEGAKRSGAYEASMETTGKQLLSMKRYLDDLKVVFGALFGGALEVGVQTLNGSLKDMKQWLQDNAIAASLVKENLKGAAENFVGMVEDALRMGSGVNSIVAGFSLWELLAGGLNLTISAIRDIMNALVGFTKAAFVDPFVNAVQTTNELIGKLQSMFSLDPPDWWKALAGWASGKNPHAGWGQMISGASLTNVREFYNGKPEPVVDPTAGYQRKPHSLTEADKITAAKRAEEAARNKALHDAAGAGTSGTKEYQAELDRLQESLVGLTQSERAAEEMKLQLLANKDHKTTANPQVYDVSEGLARFDKGQAAKLAQAELASYQQLKDQLDPLTAQSEKYANAVAVINKYETDGAEKTKLLAAAKKQYEDSTQAAAQAELASYQKLKDQLDPLTAQSQKYAEAVAAINKYETDGAEKTKLLAAAKSDLTEAGRQELAYQNSLHAEANKLNKPAGDEEQRFKDMYAGVLIGADVYARKMKEVRKQELDLKASSGDLWAQMALQCESWSQRSTDAFVEFCFTGKNQFKDLVDSMLRDIARLAVQKQVMGPLFDNLAHMLSSSSPTTDSTPVGGTASDFGSIGQTDSPTYVPTTGGPTAKTTSGPAYVPTTSTPAPSAKATGSVTNQTAITVHVNATGNSKATVDQGGSQGVSLARQIEAVCDAWAVKNKRSGGALEYAR